MSRDLSEGKHTYTHPEATILHLGWSRKQPQKQREAWPIFFSPPSLPIRGGGGGDGGKNTGDCSLLESLWRHFQISRTTGRPTRRSSSKRPKIKNKASATQPKAVVLWQQPLHHQHPSSWARRRWWWWQARQSGSPLEQRRCLCRSHPAAGLEASFPWWETLLLAMCAYV